jgi:hypothetical protein
MQIAALFFCPAGESSRALRIIEQQIYIILLYPPLTHADISGRTKGQLKNKKQLWRTSGVAGIRKTKTDRETLCFSEFFMCAYALVAAACTRCIFKSCCRRRRRRRLFSQRGAKDHS